MEEVIIKEKNHFNILSNFLVKILAIIFMTIDHVGIGLSTLSYAENSPLAITINIFRIIGRLAFPLFAFLLVEGLRHTHSTKNYLLRLASMAILIFFSYLIIYHAFGLTISGGNIFFDLLLAATSIILIEKKKTISLLAILPFLYALFCTIVNALEFSQFINWTNIFLPYFRMQYDIFGYLLILGFFYAYKLIPYIFKNEKFKDFSFEAYKTTNSYRLFANAMMIAVLIILNLIWYFISVYVPGLQYIAGGLGMESWSIFSAIIILLYNGKRGYNAKWFVYSAYAYYPVHIIIIGLIFYVIL